MKKVSLIVLVSLVGSYAVAGAVVFFAMCQPPDVFGRFMAKLPARTLLFVPFQPLWTIAREGGLKSGDPAPDFTLATADRKSRVRLSSFRGVRPVALVFGSYT